MYKLLNKQAQEIVLRINKAKNQEQFDEVLEDCRKLNKDEYQINELLKIAYEIKHKKTKEL